MIGGLVLEGKKEASINPWTIRRPRIPAKVLIPVRGAIPCVAPGDSVKTGQVIAKPEGFFSVAAHASVSGTVGEIKRFSDPQRPGETAIEVLTDGHDRVMAEIGQVRRHWQDLSGKATLDLFCASGLTGMDRWGLPLHVQMTGNHPVETLILDACETEPYVTCDYALMMSHPLEVLKGAEILRNALRARRVVLAVEDNKLEAAEVLKSKIYFLKWNHFEVSILPTKYPQNNPFSLAAAICKVDLKKYWNEDDETFEGEELRGCVSAVRALNRAGMSIANIAVAYAVYEAVVFQKPLYERVVTVGGECVIEPKNLWLPIGMSLQDALQSCKGFMREPERLVAGGPMTGFTPESVHDPVTKDTQAVLGLPKEVVAAKKEEPCIHCNRCADVCPAGISPVMITLAAERDLTSEPSHWGASFCFDCGLCTTVCPAHRPMAGLVQQAKRGKGT